MIKRTTLVLFLASCIYFGKAQNEFSKWCLGYQAGLNFSNSPPTLLTSSINAVEGCATISDNAGNLLFYTEGTTIRNSTHSVMANGSGLIGDQSDTQSSLIVKQPGNVNMYCVFTSSVLGAKAYSMVDMSLAAGLGSVTVKNATLYSPTSEKQVAVAHCNGKDVWVVSHEYNSNNFRAYLITSAGVSLSPVISPVGVVINDYSAAAGHLKISPDGKKLVMATAVNSSSSFTNTFGFHLFDFDPATGVVSNPITLLNTALAYGLEFSPDGTKLYGGAGFSSSNQSLYQWNVCASGSAAIVASQYSLNMTGSLTIGSLQRAVDSKIYITSSGQFLSVINNPNGSGAAMNFSLNVISIAPKITSGMGLPNYINTYTKPAPVPYTNTIACQTASFSVPPVPTFSSGCSTTPYPPSGYMWDFGEPSSGSANSSTLTNPVHTYSTLGTYTVSLILFNPCSNDTIKQTVNISIPGPTVSVAGVFSICKGEKRTYSASGGASYSWSGGGTASTVALSPTATTIYTVSGTVSGCTSSNAFTVEVNPCLGIGAPGAETGVRVFPNPFNQNLSVEALSPLTIIISDINGKIVYESILPVGVNQINTEMLKAGLYTISAVGASGTWHGKLVKIN